MLDLGRANEGTGFYFSHTSVEMTGRRRCVSKNSFTSAVSGCGWGMVVQQCNMLAATETLQIGTGLCPLLLCQPKPQSHHINQEEVGDGWHAQTQGRCPEADSLADNSILDKSLIFPSIIWAYLETPKGFLLNESAFVLYKRSSPLLQGGMTVHPARHPHSALLYETAWLHQPSIPV